MVSGLVILTIGAELLVRSASALASTIRIPPVLIGLTVVAFGTSTPELVVSLQSSLTGQPDIALGNVVGSNIFNVLFILGLSALIVPLQVSHRLVRVEVPLMIGLSGLMALLALDGRIGRLDGLLLTGGLVTWTGWTIIRARTGKQDDVAGEAAADSGTTPPHSWSRIALHIVLLSGSLILLVLGARWFTASAHSLARLFGIPELIIGLTVVAAGTSLPEAATSIVAAIRGERDIAVGNVVGSNIFNILGVLGMSSVASTGGIAVSPEALSFDIPVMVAVAVACLPIFFTGHLIARWEGGLFFFYSCAYTGYLIAAATSPAVSRTMEVIMAGMIIPLTVITLVITAARAFRRESGEASRRED